MRLLTAATKNGSACQKGGNCRRNVAAKICWRDGSPIAWPMFSRTAIAAYNAALVSLEIQYETSDKAETLLPKPEANTKTPCLSVNYTLAS